MSQSIQESDFIFYTSADGKINIPIIVGNETVWATQKKMAELFEVEVPNISKHITNIYEDKELDKAATVSKMETVQQEA